MEDLAALDPEKEPVVALRRALDHLSRWPGHLEASRIAGRGLSQLIYPSEAEPHYDRLRRAGLFSAVDAHARALGLTRANRREEAVEAFEAILKDSPDDPVALRRLAAVQWSRGRLEEALRLASRLVKTPDGALPGAILLAQVSHALGRWEDAIPHFRRVLELDRNLERLGQPPQVFYLEFGDDLLRTGRLAEARRLMEAAVQRYDDVGLIEVLGQAHLEEGNLDEADRWWRRAAERSPDRAKPWRVLGRMSLQTQRAGEAIVYLNRALAIDSGSYETLALLATASKVLGKTDDARDFDQRASAARRALPRLNTGMGADLPGTPP